MNKIIKDLYDRYTDLRMSIACHEIAILENKICSDEGLSTSTPDMTSSLEEDTREKNECKYEIDLEVEKEKKIMKAKFSEEAFLTNEKKLDRKIKDIEQLILLYEARERYDESKKIADDFFRKESNLKVIFREKAKEYRRKITDIEIAIEEKRLKREKIKNDAKKKEQEIQQERDKKEQEYKEIAQEKSRIAREEQKKREAEKRQIEQQKKQEEQERKKLVAEEAKRAREKEQAEREAKERLERKKIEDKTKIEIETIQLETKQLIIEEERQKRQEEAEERQRQRDFELRKMELELQIRETDLLREREERETNRANIDSLRDTLKDS